MSRMRSLVVVCGLAVFAFTGTASAQNPDMSGKWSGYWISDTNGHRGPLRATFTPLGDDAYRVKYRGRFAVVIPFRYVTTMDVVGRGDGVIILAAEKPLGPFGTFRTTATATSSGFDATFTSRRDRGRFVLKPR